MSQSLRRCEQYCQVLEEGAPRNRDSVLGMDTIYVTLWRTEQDFYVGDEEGPSGSREQRGQRHGGKKFHGTLRNTGEGQLWS